MSFRKLDIVEVIAPTSQLRGKQGLVTRLGLLLEVEFLEKGRATRLSFFPKELKLIQRRTPGGRRPR